MRGQILKKNELAEEIGITTKSIQLDIEDIRDYLDKKHTIEGSRSQLVYNHYEKGYCMKEASTRPNLKKGCLPIRA